MSNEVLVGGCLCGAVRYEVRGRIASLCHCHCKMCQKAHGSAFGTYAPVPRSAFHVTTGSSAILAYQSSPAARRLFCSRCGSQLFWDNETEFPDALFLAAATLDSAISPDEQRHIHATSKASWYQITDLWPQSEWY